MKPKPATTMDAYIRQFPPPVQKLLTQMRTIIARCAPAATEKISYQMPTFHLNGNLVHFAAFEHHIGFYPGAAVMDVFAADVKGYKSAKGSVQFPLDEPLPVKLVEKIVRFRVAQNLGKQEQTKKKTPAKKKAAASRTRVVKGATSRTTAARKTSPGRKAPAARRKASA